MPSKDDGVRFIYLRRVSSGGGVVYMPWLRIKTDELQDKILPNGGITIAYDKMKCKFGIAIHSTIDEDSRTFNKKTGRTHAAARLRQGAHEFACGNHGSLAKGFIAFPSTFDAHLGDNYESLTFWFEREVNAIISVLHDMGVDVGLLDYYNFSHNKSHK